MIQSTVKWFVTAGQMPEQPEPSARQSAFYLGMQLEELAEKLEAVFSGPTSSSESLQRLGKSFKNGYLDTAMERALALNAKDLLDADMDLLWVSIGAARAQGADPELAYDLVSAANWNKFHNGVVLKDPGSGKIRKPDGWQPPDLTSAVHPSLRSSK